jgi:hypothetical protein
MIAKETAPSAITAAQSNADWMPFLFTAKVLIVPLPQFVMRSARFNSRRNSRLLGRPDRRNSPASCCCVKRIHIDLHQSSGFVMRGCDEVCSAASGRRDRMDAARGTRESQRSCAGDASVE